MIILVEDGMVLKKFVSQLETLLKSFDTEL